MTMGVPPYGPHPPRYNPQCCAGRIRRGSGFRGLLHLFHMHRDTSYLITMLTTIL